MSKSNSISPISTDWPDSLWFASAEPLENLSALETGITTDVLVIGAGYTGLSAALHLNEKGKEVVVVDRSQPGWGCSGRNGGQINPGWKTSLAQLRQLYPGESFNRFIDTIDQSARLVFDLIDKYQINCEADPVGCIIATKGAKGVQYLNDWARFWQTYGAPVELLNAQASAEAIGHSQYDSCLLDHRGGTLQPLSYARGLARACLDQGVKIFGNTAALAVDKDGTGWTVRTPGGAIKCNRLIMATNAYTDHLWPGLAQTIIPVASMLTATKPLSAKIASRMIPDRYAVAEYSGVPPYYRIDSLNRMIFGWRGTLSGAIGSLDTQHLRARAIKLFPQLESAQWEYDWAGYVGITSHQRPMLLTLGENAYAGLGYNGRGITMATMMGKQLAQVICGEKTGLPVEQSRPVPFHRFYRLGVLARIVTGHVRDRFVRRVIAS